MIRKAQDEDQAVIAGFLRQYAETSMFLQNNLAGHGVRVAQYPHSSDFYVVESGTVLDGVFAVTKEGFVMCQVPGLTPDGASAIALALAGYTVRGVNGDAAQISTLLAALNLPADPQGFDGIEPLYRLDLDDLVEMGATIRPAAAYDIEILARWYQGYQEDTGLPAGAEGAVQTALTRAERAINGDTTRILVNDDGTPVAMTGFNARFEDMVQIGGVYTPPSLRGRGYARQAVAAHLAEARQTGITKAILFANNAAAARAYEAIGFQRCGDYRVVMLATPHQLRRTGGAR